MATVKEEKMEMLQMKRDSYQLIIGGQRMDSVSGETFTTYNPATGEAIATIAKAGKEDAEKAIQAARLALTKENGNLHR